MSIERQQNVNRISKYGGVRLIVRQRVKFHWAKPRHCWSAELKVFASQWHPEKDDVHLRHEKMEGDWSFTLPCAVSISRTGIDDVSRDTERTEEAVPHLFLGKCNLGTPEALDPMVVQHFSRRFRK